MATTSNKMLGINIYKPDATNANELLADCVKVSGTGFVGPGGDGPVPLGPDNYPAADFSIALIPSAYYYTAGRWTIYLGGQATITPMPGYGVDGTINPSTYDASSNTTTCTVDCNATGRINLAFTNTRRNPGDAPGTGVSFLKAMRPIAPGASTSHGPNEYLTRLCRQELKNFDVIRTLDLSGANNYPSFVNGVQTEVNTLNWADRRSPTNPVRVGPQPYDDLPYEDLIRFANADAEGIKPDQGWWLNIPDQATDDYLLNLARLIFFGSDATGTPYTSPQSSPFNPPPNREVYLEYSNETWNYGFTQFGRVYRAAVAAGVDLATYRAQQYLRISNIFCSVGGNDCIGTKIFPALMGQSQDVPGARESLDYLIANSPRPLTATISGVGADWYQNFQLPIIDGASTVADVIAGGISTPPNPSVGAFAALLASDPKYAGLKNYAYEGGIQLFGAVEGQNFCDTQRQVGRDPGIAALARQVVNQVFAAGADLACHYCGSGYAPFCIAPSPFNLETPRYRGTMMGINDQNPGRAVIPPPESDDCQGAIVWPTSINLIGGGVHQFRALVVGTGNLSQAGTWASDLGSIASDGTHTVPAATSTAQTYRVTYTAQANSAAVGTSYVTVPPALAPVQQGPPVADPSFELPYLGEAISATRPGGIAWSFNGNAGISSGTSYLNYLGPPNGGALPPDGSQFAFANDSTGKIAQPIVGWVTGQAYKIRLQAAQSWNAHSTNTTGSYEVVIDQIVVGRFTPAGLSFESNLTASFTVTGSNHTLQIKTTAGGGCYFDAVEILSVAADSTTITIPVPPVNYLGDPSFELCSLLPDATAYPTREGWDVLGQHGPDPSTSPIWLFVGNNGAAGIAIGGASLINSTAQPVDGNIVAFLANNASISQTVTIAQPATYTFSGFGTLRNYFGTIDVEPISLLIDGVTVATWPLTGGSGFQPFVSPDIPLLPGSHTLQIQGSGTGFAFLDDLALTMKPDGGIPTGAKDTAYALRLLRHGQ